MKNLLNQIKKNMIAMSKDFCCPVTKEVLDYRKSVIMRVIRKSDRLTKDEIISIKGWNIIKKTLPMIDYEACIIENFEDL